MEYFLDSCGRQPVLRTDLLRGGPGGCATPPSASSSSDSGLLGEALRALADRLLLPGGHVPFPGLLEVLLLTAAYDDGAVAGAGRLPPAAGTGKGVTVAGMELKCGAWARRAMALIKRSWQSEALPAALRSLDRKLAALAAQPTSGESGDGTEASAGPSGAAALRSGGAMSKVAIRAALARERLRTHLVQVERLRQQTELLCDACARLEMAESLGFTSIPEAEQLLRESDDLLLALDLGVKESSAEQDDLNNDEQQVLSAMDQQIGGFRETASAQAAKRGPLEEERANLLRRLEELDFQLKQIDEETRTWQRQADELDQKRLEQKNYYEEMIASSFCRQKRLADEKLRAVTCKESAHSVLDVVRREDHRRLEELAVQLRKRRGDLRRACSTYLHEERLVMEAAAECLGGAQPAVVKNTIMAGEGEDDVVLLASAAMQEAWRAAGRIVRRVRGSIDDASAALSDPLAAGPAEGGEAAPAEEVQAFFQQQAEGGLNCVDCGLPDADWATVTYGAYLCVDCAGRHRGLGVHLSFVRSVGMDRWTQEQLQRMRRGGTQRFLEFLAGYPALRIGPRSAQGLQTRYTSRAASYYRRLLEGRCRGEEGVGGAFPAPAAEEGHLPDLALAAGSSAKSTPRLIVGHGDEDGDDGAGLGSIAEESNALVVAYAKASGRLVTLEDLLGPASKRPSTPSTPSSAPSASAGLGQGYPGSAAALAAASRPEPAAAGHPAAASAQAVVARQAPAVAQAAAAAAEPAGLVATSATAASAVPAAGRGVPPSAAPPAAAAALAAAPPKSPAVGAPAAAASAASGSAALRPPATEATLQAFDADPLIDSAVEVHVRSSAPKQPGPKPDAGSLEDVFGGI